MRLHLRKFQQLKVQLVVLWKYEAMDLFLLFSGSILQTNRLEQKDSKQLGQKLKMEKANNVQQIRLNVNTRNFVFQNSCNAMVCIIVAEMSMEISTNQMSSLVSLIRNRNNLSWKQYVKDYHFSFEPFFT